EQVNQLLFGERAEVLEIDDHDWARIRSEWDMYEGWCKASQLTFIPRKEYHRGAKSVSGRHNDKLQFADSDMWLPIGSDLLGMKNNKIALANKAGTFKGKKLTSKKMILDEASIKEAALQYLHAPYLWGGRSIAGIDCSGLTQMAYKLCGRALPRDSSQQANEGEMVHFLQHAHCGDLAFFDNKEGKITHVGLLLDNQTILHASETSGQALIDRIDQGGIISILQKKRTHNLRFVKRFF
ncbi:MAG: NlpC/P60 family protein, partial [Methanosarcina thermophila]